MIPWDQRAARYLVRPLVGTAVRPNHITLFTLALAVGGAVLIGNGGSVWVDWGAGLFVLSRFLDHFDGELARQQNTGSRLGYYLDYVTGSLSYSALFAGLGFGFYGEMGLWSAVLGGTGAAAASISLFTNLGIDRHQFEGSGGEAIGYPSVAGFELEDGIYLLAPVAWLGFLLPFFVGAGIGAGIYCLYSFILFLRARSAARQTGGPKPLD